MDKLADKIQWHPGFIGATELELRSNRDELEFMREYNLSKEPLRIDLLIVKKHSDVEIDNEIGRIFKKHNILEYKSPEDSLNIDDYFKTIGYACLYKGMGERVDDIPENQVTVSLFREAYPQNLMAHLKKSGAVIEKPFPGIYYVSGNTLFDTQIVVTGQLNEKEHSSLRVLSKQAKEQDIKKFLEESEKIFVPGERSNVDAVLQVSIAANQLKYHKVKGEMYMCDALRELMKDEIEEEVKRGIEQGMAKAKAKLKEQGMEQGIAQGMAQGIVELGSECHLSDNEILEKLQTKLQLTLGQAQEYLAMYTPKKA